MVIYSHRKKVIDEAIFEPFINHCVAAELDHHSSASEFLNVGQRFGKYLSNSFGSI